MQLFVTAELLQQIREHERPTGYLHCTTESGGTLLARRLAGDVSRFVRYDSLRVESGRPADRKIPWLHGDPPDDSHSWTLGAGADLQPITRWDAVASTLSLRHRLPSGYQPYRATALNRPERQLLLVGKKECTFVLRRSRASRYPDYQKLWVRLPMTEFPIVLERAGINPVIEGTKIAVVGTGSVGSRVAELLAAAGAGQLWLCDPDTIELRNVRRHLCGVEYLGQAKVLAVRDELKRHGYPTLITPHLGRVQVDGADLTRNMLERCDAVVCCTESAAARQFVNHCAVTSGIPAIVADIQIRNQPLAEAVLVVPGSGGCFNCLRVKWERNGLLEPSESHDGHDYPVETASTPSGLPMHQLTALAAQACDLAALGLSTDAVSMALLTAIDGVVPGFEDLPLHQPRLEALPKDPSCEVCRGR